ncbi:MAG: hypothetical protein B7Y49_07470 [Sphingomonas sp. 28-62-11]|nr:MAG: hypothetical protein B7Y49_07470 [Sphingomonas sp. 28-62-11]
MICQFLSSRLVGNRLRRRTRRAAGTGVGSRQVEIATARPAPHYHCGLDQIDHLAPARIPQRLGERLSFAFVTRFGWRSEWRRDSRKGDSKRN